MISHRATVLLLSVVFLTCAATEVVSADREDVEFFEQQIVPILKRRCFECHSHESGKAKGGLVLDSRIGWTKGGSEGPAVVPGKPNESLLIEAVRYDGYEMPPSKKLPDSEISLLEKWVAIGAPDTRKSSERQIDPEKLWALQPIRRSETPEVADKNWPWDAIDSFVLARLESKGLTPAEDADRYKLLRRVTFDLTGLPPTPDEIEAFINDRSERAFENVVDRLLESQAFGDHWARHWFDLSCYADLAGINGGVLVRDAWRYRDYVIAAFNSDKPLNLFIHEQIAGDQLPFENIEQQRELIIATGYLAIGPWVLQNYIKGQMDADVVDHQIDRIGRTFLGQTISCARCHDHKFDPIPTRDYYALAGIFRSTLTTSYDGPGVWSQVTHITLPKMEEEPGELASRGKMLVDLTARRKQLEVELAPLLLQIPGTLDANVLTLTAGIAANENGKTYDVSFESAPTVWGRVAQATSSSDGVQVDLLRDDGSVLAGFRHQPGAWSATKIAQRLHAVQFTYTGDGSGQVRVRLTSATPGSGRFGGAVDNVVIRESDRGVFEETFDRLLPGPIKGQQPHTGLSVLARATIPEWDGAGINHSHAVDLGKGNYAIQVFGGRTRSLTAAKPVTDAQRQTHSRALAIEDELRNLTSKIDKLAQHDTPETALAVRDIASPNDSPIYKRGDFQSRGDVVPRGFLSAVSVSSRYDISAEESGRLQLAKWLTDSENPLTPRILVNRIWHHLFGQGLVRTVDYVGVHGEAPSHPELLDFLALRLQEDRWSLRKTVRRLVMSRTYQMASTHSVDGPAVDPDNRLLWRMPRRRLTAESIRDAMLAVSGELDPGRGGSPLGLELKDNIRGAGGNVNPAMWGNKIADYIKNRRSIYLPLRRERPAGELEILSTFNFPHPSEIVGARPETTVATQALFLMNSPFVKHQASKLAERLENEEANERARVRRLYLLAVSRPAELNEINTALTFLDHCSRDMASKSSDKDLRARAWTQLCHAVLASNNFLFRE